jgi:hypothetical protein
MKTFRQHPQNLLSAVALFALLAFAITGCKSKTAPIVTGSNGSDPAADGNLAPVGSQPAQALGSSASYSPTQSSESYTQQQPAPIVQGGDSQNNSGADQNYSYNAPPTDETQSSDADYYAQQPPPPLPDYDQPPDPDPNYIWTPGYWAYGSGGYYWVPGIWSPPPYYGALWTPPYWGYYGGRYAFHHGYWGPHVGFYGGIDYGYGYIGIGFFGGYWRGHDFYYNRSVTNVGHVNNVYDSRVTYNNVNYSARPNNRVSYNGGRGGISVAPRPAELAAMHEPHAKPVEAQQQVRQSSAQNKQQFFAANHGRPAEAAVARPVANAHIAEAPREVQEVQQRSVQQTQRSAPEQQQRTQPQQAEQQRNTQQQEQQRAQQQPRNDMQRPQQPQQAARPQAAAPRPEQQARPAEPQARPEQQPRTEQQARPAPQAARPAPEAHPAPQAPRPAPEARPAPQAARPAPEAHPAPAPHEAPHAEAPHEEHPK